MRLIKRKTKPIYGKQIIHAFKDIYLKAEELPNDSIEFFSGKSELKALDIKAHQILYGRRGTGKSHFLKAFSQYVNNNKEKNSNGYHAMFISCQDFIHGTPTDLENFNHQTKASLLSEFYFHNFLYKVVDNFEVLLRENENEKAQIVFNTKVLQELLYGSKHTIKIKLKKFDIKEMKDKKNNNEQSKDGEEIPFFYFDYSGIRNGIIEILDLIKINRLYICIDEWTELTKSSASYTVQQQFAQKIKQVFFNAGSISVKISSIWSQTEMNNKKIDGRFLGGIEIGQDIFPAVDLDTLFMTSKESIEFFLLKLLYKRFIYNCHKIGYSEVVEDFQKRDQDAALTFFLEELFEKKEHFNVLVAASHGVPREFLILFESCLKKVDSHFEEYSIYPELIIHEAKTYYKRGKRDLIMGNKDLGNFIKIIDDHLEKQSIKEKFFVLKNDNITMEIKELVDKKFIHQLPSSLIDGRVRDQYVFFVIDYGCYWDWRDSRRIGKDTSISPILVLNDVQISNIHNYMLDISNLTNSYVKCNNCGTLISKQNPVYEKAKICHLCADDISI